MKTRPLREGLNRPPAEMTSGSMKETDSKQGCLALKPANLTYEEATAAAYGGLLALQGRSSRAR